MSSTAKSDAIKHTCFSARQHIRELVDQDHPCSGPDLLHSRPPSISTTNPVPQLREPNKLLSAPLASRDVICCVQNLESHIIPHLTTFPFSSSTRNCAH